MAEKREYLSGFKKFILRGNVVDLSVGVLIGAAFNSVVSSFTQNILTPFIAVIIGKSNFSNLTFTIRHVDFKYGDFLNAVVSFALTALVVYYLVVMPLNTLMSRFRPEPVPDTAKCPECLSDIPKEARRCKFCTAQLK